MRFTLTYVAAAMLASAAMAAPTAAPQENNIEPDASISAVEKVTLDMGEEFQQFHWQSTGDEKTVDRSFSLNLAEPAQLQITDYKLGGDSFEILDNGEVLGSTNEVTNEDETFVATPEEAMQDERFSHATFELAAGEHDITVKVANSPYADGTGALRVVQQLQALYKNKKGGDWDDDKDDKWDDDEDWDDDWEDDKGGKWGGKDDEWDDDKGGKWDDDKWDDDKGGKWDDDKWDDDKGGKWDDDKGGKWGRKGKWDHNKKKTVYVYYKVPATEAPGNDTITEGIMPIGGHPGGETTTFYSTTGTTTITTTAVQTVAVPSVEVDTVLFTLPFLTL